MFVDVTVLQQLVRPVVIDLRESIDITSSCMSHLVAPDDVCDFSEPRVVQAIGMVGFIHLPNFAKEPVRLEAARDAQAVRELQFVGPGCLLVFNAAGREKRLRTVNQDAPATDDDTINVTDGDIDQQDAAWKPQGRRPTSCLILVIFNFINRVVIELVPKYWLAARQVLRRERLLFRSPPIWAPALREV